MENPSQILQQVLCAIMEKYDPKGNNIFSFVLVGGASGKILSSEMAVLTGKMGEHNNTDVLYLTDTQRLDDYQAPLAALQITKHGKVGNMIEFYYSELNNKEFIEIIILIKNTLENLGEGWVHQSNWLN